MGPPSHRGPEQTQLMTAPEDPAQRFDWGVHFSMDFTIKETLCQKTDKFRIGDCKHKPKGTIRDCSAEVSVHNFMQDSPLTSVNCHPLQANTPTAGMPDPKQWRLPSPE
nr:uncharacterized protein LOC118079274 isoform X2 [Zootoca vivipara]